MAQLCALLLQRCVPILYSLCKFCSPASKLLSRDPQYNATAGDRFFGSDVQGSVKHLSVLEAKFAQIWWTHCRATPNLVCEHLFVETWYLMCGPTKIKIVVSQYRILNRTTLQASHCTTKELVHPNIYNSSDNCQTPKVYKKPKIATSHQNWIATLAMESHSHWPCLWLAESLGSRSGLLNKGNKSSTPTQVRHSDPEPWLERNPLESSVNTLGTTTWFNL